VDARLIGFVPDPRLVARDYTNSVMAEIVLPPGPAPDTINGVYRLSDYIATTIAAEADCTLYSTGARGGVTMRV
jgi:hypothetical protein